MHISNVELAQNEDLWQGTTLSPFLWKKEGILGCLSCCGMMQHAWTHSLTIGTKLTFELHRLGFFFINTCIHRCWMPWRYKERSFIYSNHLPYVVNVNQIHRYWIERCWLPLMGLRPNMLPHNTRLMWPGNIFFHRGVILHQGPMITIE